MTEQGGASGRPPARRALDFLRYADWLHAARVRAYALVFLVVALGVVTWDFSRHTANGITDARGEHLARDFINYWAGARLAAEGEPDVIYDRTEFSAYQRRYAGPESESEAYNYPPVALLLSLPLAGLAFGPALAGWLALGAGLTIRLAVPRLGWSMAMAVFLGAPAVLINTLSGQNGQFTAALLAGAVTLLDRRPVVAGILFGLLSYKPQMGLLIPVALVAGGCWRTIAGAAVTVTALVGASLWLLGPGAWADFLRNAAEVRLAMAADETWWHRMPTVFAAARAAGLPTEAAGAVQAVSAIVTAAVTFVVWRRPAPTRLKAAVLAVGMFLVTPYAFDYDMVVLLFAAAWLAEAAAGRFRAWERLALGLLVALPLLMNLVTVGTGLQPAPLVLAAVLAFAVRRAGDQRLAAAEGPW